MKINIDFALLQQAVQKMGATEVHFGLREDYIPIGPLDIKLGSGFEVDFTQIEFDTGLASYEGRQVLLYIKDHSYGNKFEQAVENGQKGNRFHVADCEMLERMRQKGRLERYVVTNKLDGLFTISKNANQVGEAKESETDLKVCQYCLDTINYKSFKNIARGPQRQKFVADFNLSDFFDTYSSFFKFMPSGIADNQKTGYSDDWQNVSNTVKAKYKFICQQCGVDLKSNKRLIQTHHKNGVRSDNTANNLTPLCSDCHRKQPFHTHLFVRHNDTQAINQLRHQQGLTKKENWRDIYQLADPGMFGVINMLENHQLPMPEVGLEVLNAKHEVVSELELAWPTKKVGVAIDKESAIAATKEGWKVFSMRHALTQFEQLSNKVR
jgi:hypothetical protein